VSSEANALGFLSLYLAPALSRKSMDLIKLDLLKRFRKARTKDPLLAEVTLIHSILRLITKRRKTILAHVNPLTTQDPVFLELLKLPPDDALLLCSGSLFPLSLQAVSLALKIPEKSLEHRKHQLEVQFRSQNLDLLNLKLVQNEASSIPRPRNRGMITRFQSLPMGLRFTIETFLVLGFLLGLLWVIPEIRNLYETSIQKRINEYLIESALLDSPAPDGTSKNPREPILEDSAKEEVEITQSSSDAPSQKRQPKVNEGETWRFSFTGSATQEIETGILQILKRLKIEGAKPLGVPGGIQFDFDLRTDDLLPFKIQLETSISELQRKARSAQTTAAAYANLSWYKKKNMGTRKISPGHVQVILWISTL
jgi:hypothetical protein